MRTPFCIAAVALGLTAGLTAQTKKTLLTVSRYDSTSLDDKAGLLSSVRPFDIIAVTPAKGATATHWIPGSAISAILGDPNNDGKVAEFSGLPQASFGIGDLFIKDADRKKADPRLVYWTVRIRSVAATAPKVVVFTSTTPHTMRVGDWVRIRENGDAEFFIKQEHFVKAAGTQRGAWVNGADGLCQAPNKDLYYSSPNGPTNNGTRVAGGHWVSNGSNQVFVNDGGIVRIPASAITYDNKGNVSDVKAGSARAVLKEVGGGSLAVVPNVRQQCKNSGAMDSLGKLTSVTFTMTCLEIDPNGGTFVDMWNLKKDHPNLIFTFNNSATTCCGGPWGSWMGTVFSTKESDPTQPQQSMGTIAVINGVPMGTKTGKADGSWTGLKAGTGSSSAPLLRGLALLDTTWRSTAPYGSASLVTANDGLVTMSKDPNARLAYQAPRGVIPGVLILGGGVGMGARPLGIDLSVLFAGYASAYVFTNGPVIMGAIVPNAKGQATVAFPVPKDPKFIGAKFHWQVLALGNAPNPLTNPVVTEIRQ